MTTICLAFSHLLAGPVRGVLHDRRGRARSAIRRGHAASGLEGCRRVHFAAVLLTGLRAFGFPASFESMFTTNIGWTLLQGVVWFGVFMLILRFHPWHALGLGVATMLLCSGLATMGVESVLTKSRDRKAATRAFTSHEPVRQSLGPNTGAGAATPAAGEKAK